MKPREGHSGVDHQRNIPRAGAEVIIRRALEKADRDATMNRSTMDVDTVAVVAAEVGVPAVSVAEAVAEAQVGVDSAASLIDRVVGPKTVWTSRTVHTDEETIRHRTIDWLSSNHGLRTTVRANGVVVAQRRADVAGKVGEGLRKLQGMGGLAEAAEVHAAAVNADDTHGSVCLAADVGNKRIEAVVGGGAVATIGIFAVSASAVVTPFALLALPVCAGAGALVSRLAHRSTVKQFNRLLDETADGVTRGDRSPHPLDPLKKAGRGR